MSASSSSQPNLKWSAQFAVSTTRSQGLPGDKILLPPTALEQLLSASSNLAAERARQDLPAYDPFNSSTYAAYRQADSQYQDQRQQLPYPLTFRLVNPQNGRVVYAGIQEFSAEEEEVVLSPFLLEALGLNLEELNGNDDNVMDTEAAEPTTTDKSKWSITVHVKELPKGTFVKLRPLEPGYDPEDWKALLEQYMRQNYTTLTNGEVLVVPGARGSRGKREEFRFLVDGFKPETDGICVVDTDLEVDIEALNEEQARETLKRIAAKMARAAGTDQGSSAGGKIDLFKAQQGRVVPGEYVDYELSSWNRALPLELELELIGEDDADDIDLLVSPFSATQRAKPRLDEHIFADFDGRPRKRIRLESSNIEMEDAEALYISVYAFAPTDSNPTGEDGKALSPRQFTLKARHPDTQEKTSTSQDMDNEMPSNEGDVRCKNCHQWVPQRTLMLHENFCLRNNVICPKGCGQVFRKRSPEFDDHWHCPYDSSFGNTVTSHERHNTLNHPQDVLHCSDCSTKETFASLPSLARHRTSVCPGKLILCRFCHLVVPQEGDPDIPNAEALLSGLTPHELADGARTTECHLCSKIVRLRDMETHRRNHDLDRLSRPPPLPCRNINCGRTLDVCSKSGDTRAGSRIGQGHGNDVALCSVCFGPLYVSLYDPENKALRRRIERRYLQQLITGCGKGWCRNDYCKTARKSLNLSTNITTKDAIPMVKPFVDGTGKSAAESPFHFCVDEASQNRRALAIMLAAEDGGPTGRGGYGLDWCVGALEAENGNLDGAGQWLKNWAPTRNEVK